MILYLIGSVLELFKFITILLTQVQYIIC